MDSLNSSKKVKMDSPNSSKKAQNPLFLIIRFVAIFLLVTLGPLILFPSILLLHAGNGLIRFFVSMFLLLFYGDEVTLNPTGYDGMYMYKGHRNGKRMIIYVAVQEGPLDIESHRRSYLNHLVNLPHYQKLKKIWTTRLGYFCLQHDTKFAIENHVKAYKDLGDLHRVVTEEELLSKILPHLSNDMDETKPQWEDVIIPRFRYGRESDMSTSLTDKSIKSVRIFRIHHGYMDGLSTMLMLAYSQSEGRNFPWIVDPLASPNRSVLSKVLFYASCFAASTPHIVKQLINPPNTMKNRWVVHNFTGETVYSWSKAIPVTLLRKIKSDSGVSMPSVLCSILTSSLRRLEEEFESKDPEYQGRISEEIVIGLVAAMLPYPDLELRNNHCMVQCHLNSRELSRMERLGEIDKEMRRLSRSPELYLNNMLPKFYGVMPAWIANLCTRMIAGCGVVSNFPAASRKVKLWGNEVSEMAGWVPMLVPSGFGCVTLRYADHLRFCLNADTAALSEKQLTFLVETIGEEAEALGRECSAEMSRGQVDKNGSDDTLNNNDDHVVEDNRLQMAIDRLINSVNKVKNA